MKDSSLMPRKVACITPAFKKEDRLDQTNYMPISVLNVFSKVFEHFILDQSTTYFKSMLSEFRSAYRKQYSCQHVLLRMIETWRKYLNENKIVGTTLTNLSKAFNSLPHDLLVAKLEAYGLNTKTKTYAIVSEWTRLVFSTAKQLQKIEKIQERVLRFLHDDYVSDYLMLLKVSGSVSMEVRRMRYLGVEIYKTLNDLNPGYMKDIFQVQQSA